MPKPFPDNPPNRPVGVTLPGEEENPIVVAIEPGFASGERVPGPPENRTEKGRRSREERAAVDENAQADTEGDSVTDPAPDRHSPVEDTASATTTDASTERGALRAK